MPKSQIEITDTQTSKLNYQWQIHAYILPPNENIYIYMIDRASFKQYTNIYIYTQTKVS